VRRAVARVAGARYDAGESRRDNGEEGRMAEETAVAAPAVEDLDGITVIRGSQLVRNWNGINYALGMSAKNVGTEALSVNLATVPPGGIAYAHIHDGFEVILYIMQGRVRHIYGEGLSKSV